MADVVGAGASGSLSLIPRAVLLANCGYRLARLFLHRGLGLEDGGPRGRSTWYPRRRGVLSTTWAILSFRVPLGETNNYVLDSVLLMLSHAVENQPTANDRGRIAGAVESLEKYYQI